MKNLFLALVLGLALVTPVNAQTLAPSDIPASVLVSVSSTTFVASPLTTVACDATSNAILVTLPDATLVPAGKGLKIVLVITGSSHHVTFAVANSQTINGLSASDFSSASYLGTAATSLSFVSNGSNWLASTGSL